MSRPLPFLVLGLALLLVPAFPAQEKKPAEKKAADLLASKLDLNKIADAVPGVYNIELDDKGRIVSLHALGASRISTVLGAAKGKEVARQRASQQASAEFVKFLKTSTKAYEKSESETVTFLEGHEGNDKDAMNESGKSIERTSSRFEERAEGMVRGMTIAAAETIEKDKTMVIVKRWRAKIADGAKGIEDREKPKAKDGKSSTESKKIGDKKIIIDD